MRDCEDGCGSPQPPECVAQHLSPASRIDPATVTRPINLQRSHLGMRCPALSPASPLGIGLTGVEQGYLLVDHPFEVWIADEAGDLLFG